MMGIQGVPTKQSLGFGINNQFEFKTKKVFSFLGGISTDFQFIRNTKISSFKSSTATIDVTHATSQRINFPLTCRFNFGKKLKFFCEFSLVPIVSIIYGDMVETEFHRASPSVSEKENIISHGNIGASTGLGIRYPFAKRVELVIKTDVMIFGSDSPASGDIVYNLHIGFNYHFNKYYKQKQN
jgi:hypothetical protein